jgi:hypothetical protein
VALARGASGLWEAAIEAEEPGVYRIDMDGLSAVALVGAVNSKEFSKVVTTDEVVKPIAEASGGGMFFMGAGDAEQPALPRLVMMAGAKKMHSSGWMGLRDREAHVTLGVEYTPLFTGFAALGLLLGFFGLTWWREGR